MRVIVAISTLLICLGVARAEPSSGEKLRAKAHFKNGAAFFEAGQYDAAISEYEEAFRLLPLADFQYNIGQAYRKKGDLRQAYQHYLQYLEMDPRGAAASEAKRALDELAGEIDAQNKAEAEARARATTQAKERADAELQKEQEARARIEADKQARLEAEKQTQSDAASRKQPIYKKWWLWTGVAVVAAGVAVGVGCGVGLSGHATFNSSLGEVGPGGHNGLTIRF